VRLKGGDPSIFGRAGEEHEFLHANGVEVEVVPGVTAACAAAAQFGFPLTHRGEARRLLISTATVTGGITVQGGWWAAADPETTLALYMGRDQMRSVADRLIAEGRRGSTPAIAVENAGHGNARAVSSTLEHLAAALGEARATGPVVVLIGDVAARADLAAVGSATVHRLRSA
jgi:uroporphyrin-III C-methyltransferase